MGCFTPGKWEYVMTLRQKQSKFARMIAELLREAHARGYEVTLDEFYRPPETAALYESQGRGSKNSLHCIKLAADINVFKNGRLLKAKEYEPLGVFWESIGGSWGGRFKSLPDARHFSLAHGNMR